MPFGDDHVLVGIGQAGEQRQGRALRPARVDALRLGKRLFRQEGHDRVDLRVHALDLRDEGAHELDRRDLAGPKHAGELACGKEDEVSHNWGQTPIKLIAGVFGGAKTTGLT
jgi:hypothetical protein